MTEKRRSSVMTTLCTLLLWGISVALIRFALTRSEGVQWLLFICGILAFLMGCIPAYLIFLSIKTKDELPILDINNYANFTGVLTAIQLNNETPDTVYLVLENEEQSIRVKFGAAGAALFEIGERLVIGHIGEQVVNLRPTRIRNISEIYNNVDFRGGLPTFIESHGEDMMTVQYGHGFSIDVGYIEHNARYYVTILKDENWNPYLEQYEAVTMNEMLQKLQQAIDWIVAAQEQRR